jgi:hypothetical protein
MASVTVTQKLLISDGPELVVVARRARATPSIDKGMPRSL